jgi:hypothetical protein
MVGPWFVFKSFLYISSFNNKGNAEGNAHSSFLLNYKEEQQKMVQDRQMSVLMKNKNIIDRQLKAAQKAMQAEEACRKMQNKKKLKRQKSLF